MKRSDRPRGLSTTGKTREATILFFDAVIERRFSDADKALETIRSRKYASPEFQEGYIKALEGMLTSARSGDERDFFNKADFTEESMERYSHDFRSILLKGYPKPFDVGFMSAWADLMHYRLASNKISARSE
jgi:hypothetical protein